MKKIIELRAFPNKKDKYKTFIDKEFVAIGWPKIGDITSRNQNEIKEKLLKKYPELEENGGYLTQISTFFSRFKSLKENDLILIPYNDNNLTITIASVTKTYYYDKNYFDEHMSHQVGIKVEKIIDQKYLSSSLKNTLKARLTLTNISAEKHKEILSLLTSTPKYDKEKFAYKENIKQIIKKYEENKDPLVKKSLILAAFSICESYLVDFIKLEIGKKDGNPKIWDVEPKSIIENNGRKKILDKLKKFQERKGIFKQLFENKLSFPSEQQQELRNTLAHDVTTPTLDNNIIFYTNIKSGEEKEEDVSQLMKSILNFADLLESYQL